MNYVEQNQVGGRLTNWHPVKLSLECSEWPYLHDWAFLAPLGQEGLSSLSIWEVPLLGMMWIVWRPVHLSWGPRVRILIEVITPQYSYSPKSSSLQGWELEIAFSALLQAEEHINYVLASFQAISTIRTGCIDRRSYWYVGHEYNTWSRCYIIRVFICPWTYHTLTLCWLTRNNFMSD